MILQSQKVGRSVTVQRYDPPKFLAPTNGDTTSLIPPQFSRLSRQSQGFWQFFYSPKVLLKSFHIQCGYNFFFPCMFFANQLFIFVIFTSVAPHRGQPAAKCHPRWQPTRRLAVSCGLGRHRIQTRDCRTTVLHATIELTRLPRGVDTIFGRFFPWK